MKCCRCWLQVKFLLSAYKKFSNGKQPARALELGCGPARHSIGLAQKGIYVAALDLSPAMLGYAGQQAEAAGASVEFVQGDMQRFDFQEQQFDLIVCLLGTFSHMLENSQVSALGAGSRQKTALPLHHHLVAC